MNLKDSWKDVKEKKKKRNRLEIALFNFIKETEKVEDKVVGLIDNNNIKRSEIASMMDKLKCKLKTLDVNLKNY